MPESQRFLTSLSFIIRLWFERGTHRGVRGRITRVSEQGQHQQRPVAKLSDITAFIEESLEEEGIAVERKRCAWRRFKRAPPRGRR